MLNKQVEIERFAQGSTGQVELGKNHLQTLKMLVPEISLQVKFEAIISPLLKEEANLEIQNQQLTKLRDWLLPMLMNGQVTVK